MLEEAIHNGFYNFSIVDENTFEFNMHIQYPRPYIDSIVGLPEFNNAF